MGKIPSRIDRVLLPFSLNFRDRITLDPGRYPLPAGAAALYAGLHEAYAAALAVSDDPGRRTPPAVILKNGAKSVLRAKLRQYIRVLTADRSVSDSMLADLGLPPRRAGGTPILSPTTRPLLIVDPFGKLRVTDEATPGRRAKPAGTVGAVVFYKVLDAGAPFPAAPQDGRYAGLASTDRFVIPVTAADVGRVLWTQAFWITAKGQPGPASAAVTTRIAA